MGRDATGGRAACRAGTGAGAGVAAGGRPVSRYPDALRSTNGPSIPGIAAASVIGRPTASSGRAAICTPRSSAGPGSSWPPSSRTGPPTKASGPNGDVLPAAGGGQGQRHARHARLRDELGMATYFADPYSSWQQREPQRHDPVPAQTRRHRPRHGARGSGDRRRDQQPPHARARIPHTRRGVHRRTAKLKDPTRLLHLQIDNGDSI